MDIDAEREKIRQEIEELERNLGPGLQGVDLDGSSSSLESEDEDGSEDSDGSDAQAEMVDPKDPQMEGESEAIIHLPQTPETCLQMNLVYQEILQEKLEEVRQLLAQNKQQQEKLAWDLSGRRVPKSSAGKPLPGNIFLGHFMKPYFKDVTSGLGPPANSEKREKAKQGIKAFEELLTPKWKSREKQLLRESVLSDRLQRLLQPKLLNLSYLNEKLAKSRDEMERQILEKQIREKENEIKEINLLPEESLLANRFEEHDWEKIANVNFEGTRSGNELRTFWQNSEHPDINRKEWGPEEIEALKEIALRHNSFDWAAIAQELGTHRTAFQCLQKFQAYNKDFKKREWTPEEDRMLLQMVQEMRVGKHIPYRKIAYYMEGRDSAQLIYRWTKRVDPKLKHGAWTPREDALLLKAVAKFGAQDWYKIRAEVPGRSDQQCRDRYLHALHFDIKKGKWSKEEETKLVELTEKYGVGHWAEIASELPHRSGTQCLSKWKVLLGYRRNRKQSKKPPRRKQVPRGSASPLESSSDTSDLDLDTESEEEDEGRKKKEKERRSWRVPDLDLWVPTRKTPNGPPKRCNRKEGSPNQVPDLDLWVSTRKTPQGPSKGCDRKKGSPKQMAKYTKDSWKVSLPFVRSVLRKNSYEQHRKNREIQRRKRFAAVSTSQAPPRQPLTPGGRGRAWKTSLHRQLMMAVTPWAEGRVQERRLRATQEAGVTSKAEFISKALQSARLPSTPFFTLFIQLLRIDVGGCMKVIQKQKSRPTGNLKSVVANKRWTKQASSDSTGSYLPVAPSSSSSEALPCRPAAKPRTVSELLREKRLREAQKAQQSRTLLAPNFLLRPQSPAPNLQILLPERPNLQIPAPNLQISMAERPNPSFQMPVMERPSPAPNLHIPMAEHPNTGPDLQIPTPNHQISVAEHHNPSLQTSVVEWPNLNLQIPVVERSNPNLQIPMAEHPNTTSDFKIPTPNLQISVVEHHNPSLQTSVVEHPNPSLQIPMAEHPNTTPNLQISVAEHHNTSLQKSVVECPNPNLQIAVAEHHSPGLQTSVVECLNPNLQIPMLEHTNTTSDLQIPTPNLQISMAEHHNPSLKTSVVEHTNPNLQIPMLEHTNTTSDLQIPTPNLQISVADHSNPSLQTSVVEHTNPNLQIPMAEHPNTTPNLQISVAEHHNPSLQTSVVECPNPSLQIPVVEHHSLGLQTSVVECPSPKLQIPMLEHPNTTSDLQIPTPNLQISMAEHHNPSLQTSVVESPNPSLQIPVAEHHSPGLQTSVVEHPNLQIPMAEHPNTTPNLQIPTPNLQISRVECSSPNLQTSTPNLQIPMAERPNLHLSPNPHNVSLGTPTSNSQGLPVPSNKHGCSATPPPVALSLSWVLTPQGLLPVVHLPGQTGNPITCPVTSTQASASSESHNTPPFTAVSSEAVLRHPISGDPPGKASLDYRLLSTEDTATAKRWSQGEGGPSGLPYLPPFLCSLRTLSALLQLKESLLRQAASLRVPEGSGETGFRTLVRQRLQGNPAYELLKGRFLAAFAFPAALATLPPFRVTTTISRADLDPSSEETEEEDDEDDEEEVEREPHETERDSPGKAANSRKSPTELKESGAEVSNPEPFLIRRSSRLQKRKNQL
nr:snRNA-activating protein complex subunit 4 [Anolis sagrei ordinatus]